MRQWDAFPELGVINDVGFRCGLGHENTVWHTPVRVLEAAPVLKHLEKLNDKMKWMKIYKEQDRAHLSFAILEDALAAYEAFMKEIKA